MSKRLCVSLVSPRSSPTLQQCSALRPSTVRGDNISTTTTTFFLRNQNSSPRRQFSLTTHRSAVAGSRMRPNQKAQPSISVAMKRQQKEAEKDGTVLDHLGVLDGTFIYPTGRNLPSLTSNPRGRFTIELNRIRTAIIDWGAALMMRIWVVRPRMWSGKELERRKVVGVAKEIYEGMYANFARGDLTPVEKQLKPGLLSSLRSRLAQRPAGSGMHWTMHGYVSRPKVMSFKFITLPGGSNREKNGIVQAVVKMRSKQSLLKLQKVRVKDEESGKAVMRAVPVDATGAPIPEGEVEEMKERNSKVTTEYVVLQKMMKKGKFERWQMWGTAEESSLAKLEQDHRDMVAKQDQMAAMRGQM